MAQNRFGTFWNELRRRKVVRVAVVYAIVAWVVTEVSSVVFPSLLLPDWTSRLVVAMALLGFPVAVSLAWAFQLTPESESVEPATATTEPTADERLDGWKRMAAYLNRDVRTLRRWEANEGLPVRRLMHDRQATVYAYRSELDAWLLARAEAGVAPTQARSAEADFEHRRMMPWLVAAVAILVLASGAYWLFGRTSERAPAIHLAEWDWVLITRFDNRTGESVLDGTVEYALQRELANSSYVKVVPRERIIDALRLMKQAADTPIDIEKGREISLRDGGIRMLVAGRIDKLGNNYQISAELVNPDDGVTLSSFRADAAGQDQILPQISQLAVEVRSGLGEGLPSIRASEEQLAKVTTPSLEALRLFSDANRLMASAQRHRALPILEQAVRIDPDFASAHLLLWYALMDRDEVARAQQHLERAVALADQASERERLFILASYYGGYLNDSAKAIETYQLLLRLYPDHFWAASNLAGILENLGRLEESFPYQVARANLRPNLWYAQFDALQFALVIDDREAIETYRERTMAIADPDPYFNAGFALLPAFEAWSDGDYTGAVAATERLIASMDAEELVSKYQGWLFAQVRSMYLALGQLHRFRELSALRAQIGWFQAMLDRDAGHPETLGRYLESDEVSFWQATMLALDGQIERARAILDNPRVNESLPPFLPMMAYKRLALAQIALSEGRFQDVVDLLDRGMLILNITSKTDYLFAVHTLAEAFVGLDRVPEAIEVLEIASLQEPLTIFDPNGTYMWQRNQLYLVELDRQMQRTAAADRAAEALRRSLRLADDDHPFALSLGPMPAQP